MNPVDEHTAKLVRRLYPNAARLSRARYYQLVRKVRAEMARNTNESSASSPRDQAENLNGRPARSDGDAH
jgi:hypothetical protein